MSLWPKRVWGGANVRDQADELVGRSHVPVPGGFAQRAPMESPFTRNMEYHPQGIRQRRGSALLVDFSSLLNSGETCLMGKAVRNASGNAEQIIIVGTKSIYVREGAASFKQIKTSAAGAFTHDSDPTLASIMTADGHHLVLTNGANNEMQAYKTGDDLDPEMKLNNTYEEAFSATTHTITGAWATAAYLGAVVHSRLVYSDGNTQMEHTPMAHTASSGIWDLAGSTAGFFLTEGAMRMMAVFKGEGQDDTDAILYVGVPSGLIATTGFQDYDRVRENVTNEAALNHQAFFVSRNWLVYLTRNKNLLAVNGSRVLDLGARLRAADGTGPLDDLDITNSEANAYGFYSPIHKIGGFGFSTSSARVNDRIVILDFNLDEPDPRRDSDATAEPKVRLLDWRIANPDDNDWFIHVFPIEGALVGLTSTGKLYTMLSGKDDLDSLPVQARHKTPVFTGGDELVANIVQWINESVNNISTGKWDMTVKCYEDRADAAVYEYLVPQVEDDAFILGESLLGDALVGDVLMSHIERLSLRSETIQFEYANEGTGEEFILTTGLTTYEPGALVR